MCFVALFSFHAARSQVYTYQVKNEAALFKKIHFNDFDNVPTKVIPALSAAERARLAEEDSIANRKNVNAGYRFATQIPVDINSQKDGNWIEQNGQLVWSVKIVAEQAKSISLAFSDFKLPDGGKLYCLSGNRTMLLGEVTNSQSSQSARFVVQK